ncbi:twin-arginine translocation signal domain-containing protein [Glycomyces sp. NPDC049804]|uniref:twin-arginine translocation signal domain-containing protein n=1 Tax=Glycomyces sp. NPDC049804 TaxID=3154363 RepID=UPI00342826BD
MTNPPQPGSSRRTALKRIAATAAAAVTAPLIGGVDPARAADAAARQIGTAAWETLIDGNSFASRAALESEWNYLYPWGADHNGTARMYASSTDANHCFISPAGVLNLKATRITWNEGNSSKDPYLPIRYHSAAIHAKNQVLVNDRYPNWEIRGEFQAPSAPGTWPAFWITGAASWPPESDILEYKGDNRNWFNTYDGAWDNTLVTVASPGSWHEYRIWMTKTSAADVQIHYYLDDVWKAAHTGSNFVGKPMNIIINLQMEGSSGANGPTGDTYYKARNVYVGRTNNG